MFSTKTFEFMGRAMCDSFSFVASFATLQSLLDISPTTGILISLVPAIMTDCAVKDMCHGAARFFSGEAFDDFITATTAAAALLEATQEHAHVNMTFRNTHRDQHSRQPTASRPPRTT